MIISHYNPNALGPEQYYSFDPLIGLDSLQVLDDRPCRINGWLLTSKKLGGPLLKWVCFGDGGAIYFDLGDGKKNFSNGEISFNLKAFLNISTVEVSIREHPLELIRVVTPLSRYIFNDGMFPDDVEPIKAVIRMLQDPDELRRLEKVLSDGITLE